MLFSLIIFFVFDVVRIPDSYEVLGSAARIDSGRRLVLPGLLQRQERDRPGRREGVQVLEEELENAFEARKRKEEERLGKGSGHCWTY